jgi:amino acid adenylation domain-containing protein
MGNDSLTGRFANLSPAKRALLELRLKEKSPEPLITLSIPRRSAGDTAPLSFAQQRLWFLNQLEPESPAYNESHTFRLSGTLDRDAFKMALNQVVLRHEVLRTTIVTVDGSPCQLVVSNRTVDLPVIDLHAVPNTDRDSEAQRLIVETIRKPFDLSRDLMLRVLLLQLAEKEHIFLVVKHHIASDKWSLGILWKELSAIYEAFVSGKTSPLPELPIQYADYAVWQREWLQGDILERQLSYWKKQLAGLGALQLPTDRPRPSVRSFQGKRQTLDLSKQLSQKLEALSRQQGTTLFMTLLAAFQTLLYRYTGQEDIAVGCPIAGRTRQELEELIGFFVNTLIMRVNFSGNPTFRELLARIREVALGAYAHQDLPFEKLVEELQPERNLTHSPLFQVAFAYQNTPTHALEISRVLVTPVEKIVETTKFDLHLSVNVVDEGIAATLHYATDLYDDVTILRLLSHFRVLLEGMVADPNRRVFEVPILTEAEEHQLLVEWNDTNRDYPKDTYIHQLFEEQVEKSPDAVAVVFENQQLTYRELNTRANQVAHYLQKLGVGRETLVAICMERSLDMVVGLLGILKAGGAYVPLDPEYPKERLAFLMEDAQSAVLLTHERLQEKFPHAHARIVCLDGDWEQIAKENQENTKNKMTGDDTAYVIYTSGTTGQPKGVIITHHNVARLFRATEHWFHFSKNDVWTMFHSYAFDFSVWEMWGALAYGGRIVIVPFWISRSPENFYELLCQEKITVLNQTPSVFRQLIQADQSLSNQTEMALRLVIFGGEALDFQSLRPWLDRHGDQYPQLVNMYGITETTVHVTCRVIRSTDVKQDVGSVIGVPLPDLNLYVLDRHGQLVPIGIPGELYVGGAGVGRGYLNRPELTDERFVANPFNVRKSTKLYRTGDLVRRLSDGDIEYLGRTDAQVKVRGFRIELGEIESTLARHSSVQEVAVLAREDVPGDKRLVAYVVATACASPTAHDLRAFLKERLPEYMVPSAFVFLEKLPVTPNGKIDRKALPEPEERRPELEEGYVAPRNPVEELLAKIWAEVLKLEKIGIHDNFFSLGGHSLKVTQVISRVREALQLNLSVRVLFEAPTVAELASRIEHSTSEAGELEELARNMAEVEALSEEEIRREANRA